VELHGVHPALAEERGRFAEYVTELAGRAEAALRRHGREIVNRQIVLKRFADAAADVYLMAAVLSRADAALRRHEGSPADPEKSRSRGDDAAKRKTTGQERASDAPPAELPEVLRCRILVNDAWRRARRNLAMMDSNPDADLLTVADEILERGGYAGGETGP
jgi:hypothetical protein